MWCHNPSNIMVYFFNCLICFSSQTYQFSVSDFFYVIWLLHFLALPVWKTREAAWLIFSEPTLISSYLPFFFSNHSFSVVFFFLNKFHHDTLKLMLISFVGRLMTQLILFLQTLILFISKFYHSLFFP